MKLLLIIAAIVLFLLAAAFDFGWLDANDPHTLGFVALGLAALAGSKIVP